MFRNEAGMWCLFISESIECNYIRIHNEMQKLQGVVPSRDVRKRGLRTGREIGRGANNWDALKLHRELKIK